MSSTLLFLNTYLYFLNKILPQLIAFINKMEEKEAFQLVFFCLPKRALVVDAPLRSRSSICWYIITSLVLLFLI